MLRHVDSARLFRLRPRTTIGRGPASVMRLRSPLASSEHAVLSWSGDCWLMRDLGSRNGTWLGDRRLAPGEAAPVGKGDLLAFGDAGDRWQLIDADPPRLYAESLVGDRVVDSVGGVLALPSADDPQVMVFGAGEGWLIEDDAGTRCTRDQDVVLAGDVPWRLAVPELVAGTLTAELAATPSPMVLRLRHGADRQFVEVAVRRDGQWVELAPRAHHLMLLVLAEERRRDVDARAAERGWLHVEDLSEWLGHDRRTINVHICRLRQQLGEAGVPESAAIVERRLGTGQIRLGTDAVQVEEL